MRKLMKLIATTAITLLLLALITCAAADEKIYTSPVFKLPRERLERAEEILGGQEEEGEPEESEDLADEPEDEGEIPEEGETTDEDIPGEEIPGEEIPGEEIPGEEIPGEEIPGEEIPGEDDPEDVTPDEDEDEDFEALDDDAGEVDDNTGEVEEEPARPKREVIIRSNQGAVVTEGDQITMTSELRGFGDDEQVTYQWQVDRGDGAGWVDVNGATKFKYTFIANEETIKYSWRLIVNVIE